MKKILIFFGCLLLIFTNYSPISVNAANSSISGPSTVRAGNTITLTVKVSGSDLSGIELNVKYDKSQLSLTGYSNGLGSSWSNSYSDKNGSISIIAYDQNGDKPINSGTVATLKFKVDSDLSTGETISVSLSGSASDPEGASAGNFSSSYSKKITAPLSSNADLSSLKVSNANISPSFNPDTTSYTANVGFEISKLSISADTEDSGAKVSISNNSLSVGSTTSVKITVTAANNNTKTYTIRVTRAQDPNYVPSDNNNLANLSVDDYQISPKFTTENLNYRVYLPYETSSIKVTPTLSDSKGSVIVANNQELEVGENNVSVTVKAENGEQKIYTIIAERMPSLDGAVDSQIPEVNQTLYSAMSAIIDEDKTKPHTFYLNFIGVNNKIVDGKIFEKLKEFTESYLVIQFDYGTITFNSKDIENVGEETYNFSFVLNQELVLDGVPTNVGENQLSYTIGEDKLSNLPGYGTFKIFTGFDNQNLYNVYRFDREKTTDYLIAKEVEIDENGYIVYRDNIIGEFLVSNLVLADTVEHLSVANQNITNSNQEIEIVVPIISGLVCLIVGYLIGYLPMKNKFKKFIEKRKKDNEDSVK